MALSTAAVSFSFADPITRRAHTMDFACFTLSLLSGSCAPATCFPCQMGLADLSCTGFHGGGGASTGWLWTDAPTVAGVIMALDLSVFYLGDSQNDTLVLLDGFRFHLPFRCWWGPPSTIA